MAEPLHSTKAFPRTEMIAGEHISFRLMTPEDRERVLLFTKTLTQNDILYLQMDIRREEVIDESIENIKRGRAVVVMAVSESGACLGYASVFHNELLWTRHQAEIRLFVGQSFRGRGLGKRLAADAFQLALDLKLDLVVVQIPREQPQLRQMLERIGFKVEALLTDWLMDQQGKTHDLIIMAHHVQDY